MHSYREDGKVKKETVANLSHLPDECVELIRGYLAGEQYVKAREHFKIEGALPHGHVEAVLAMFKRLELARLLPIASRVQNAIWSWQWSPSASSRLARSSLRAEP
jgi:hypothetical protein